MRLINEDLVKTNSCTRTLKMEMEMKMWKSALHNPGFFPSCCMYVALVILAAFEVLAYK